MDREETDEEKISIEKALYNDIRGAIVGVFDYVVDSEKEGSKTIRRYGINKKYVV